LQPERQVKIDNAAVIVKDESGKVKVENQLDTGVKGSAVLGGTLGLLMASVFFPVAGLVIGAIGGALIGKSLHHGVDEKSVKEVMDSLKPGMSALFVIGSGRPAAVRAALQPFQGTVYQITFSSEAIERCIQRSRTGNKQKHGWMVHPISQLYIFMEVHNQWQH
jgi:uncharacterized membrane protein